MFGSANNDRLFGWSSAKLEVFRGFAGDDLIDGRSGNDFVNYRTERGPSSVSVDLGARTATDSFGDRDTLRNIEGAAGTPFDDLLRGSSADNFLFGDAGNDTIEGLDGDDELRGEIGNDVLRGGNGFDTTTLDGLSSGFRLVDRGSFWELRDLDQSDRDLGTDRLFTMERVVFTDTEIMIG